MNPYKGAMFVGSALFLTIGCSPIWESKERDKRIEALEKRVTSLETQLHDTQMDRKTRQESLEECVKQADRDYWDYLRRNGKTNADGSLNAPLVVVEQARKNKQAKIEECKLLYGR